MYQILIGLFLIAFVSWFLIDRHYFVKKTNKAYDELLDEIYKKYKVSFDEVVEQSKNFDEARWDSMLVSACGDDQENLRNKFAPGWSMVTLNAELDQAAKDYVAAFKSQAPLKAKVARIINLLYLFVLSKNSEESAKLDQIQRLRLKNLN